jgi:hypothetical protein
MYSWATISTVSAPADAPALAPALADGVAGGAAGTALALASGLAVAGDGDAPPLHAATSVTRRARNVSDVAMEWRMRGSTSSVDG